MPSKTLDLRLSVRVALIVFFSVLTFLSALLNKFTLQGGQIIFSIVYATGVLILNFLGGATLIALIAGSLYMFHSILGFLSLATFLVRGVITDLLFLGLGVYREARTGNPSWVKIAIAMMVASFLTGLFQYLFFVIFVKMLIDFGKFIVSLIFIVAIISNGIAGFLVGKVILPRIHKTRRAT